MIYLEKNTTNLIAIQAIDMTTIDSPFYLFRFVDDQRKTQYLIQLDKNNPGNKRFDSFSLTLPDDLDMESGKYHMYIYQSDTDGETDYTNMPLLTLTRAEVAKQFKTPTVYEREESTDYVYSVPS